MKRLLLVVILVCLCIPLAAMAIEVDSLESFEAALADTSVDSITVTAPMAFGEGEFIIDKPVIFHSTNFVTDILIEKDASVVLTEGGFIGTVSNFGEPFFINRILIQGKLDARAGTIKEGSFFVVDSGASFLYQEGAEGFSVDYTVTSQDELFNALENPLLGSIVLQGGEEDVTLDLDKSLALSGELYVIAGKGLTSLRIIEGGSITADDFSALGTQSNTDSENGAVNVGRFWIDGGSFEAKAESILPDSTIFITGGTLILDDAPKDVDIIGCPATEEDLIAYLENSIITEIFVQSDITLTQEIIIGKHLKVMNGARIINTGTVTVSGGIELSVTEDGTFENQGTVLNSGIILIQDGAYEGAEPEGSGEFRKE